MATTAPGELHDGKDGQRELYKLVNWLRRQFPLSDHSGTIGRCDGILTAPVGVPLLLSTLDSSGIGEGSLCKVDTVGDYFGLYPTAIATDPMTVVNAFNKPGYQWLRLGIPNSQWQKQAVWSVDELNSTAVANDENTGADDTHPLASAAELARRVRGSRYATGTSCVVRNLSQMSNAFFDVYGTGRPGGTSTPFTINGFFTIVGVPTVAYAGTMSSVSQTAAGGNGDNHFTDAGAPAFSQAGNVWKRTNGTAAYFWPQKDLTGGVWRISQPESTTVPATLSNGDSWQILTLPSVKNLWFRRTADYNQYQIALCAVRDTVVGNNDSAIRWVCCQFFQNTVLLGGEFRNCMDWMQTCSGVTTQAIVLAQGGLVTNAFGSRSVPAGAAFFMSGGTNADYVSFQSTGFTLDHRAHVTESEVMFYDNTGPCVSTVGSNGSANFATIGGSGNSDKIVSIGHGGVLVAIDAFSGAMTSDPSPFTNNGVSTAGIPNNDVTLASFIVPS